MLNKWCPVSMTSINSIDIDEEIEIYVTKIDKNGKRYVQKKWLFPDEDLEGNVVAFMTEFDKKPEPYSGELIYGRG